MSRKSVLGQSFLAFVAISAALGLAPRPLFADGQPGVVKPLQTFVAEGIHGLRLYVVPEGPATRETPLQIACFFRHDPKGDVYSGGTGAFAEKMRGLVKNLRDRGEFEGEERETILLTPPPGTVPAKQVLLIGLGDPVTFATDYETRMRRIGAVAVREAVRLGVDRVSFSPNVTDAGVKTVSVGDCDRAVMEGVFLAYDTEVRLQKEGAAPAHRLTEWTLEAGPQNVTAAADAIRLAITSATARTTARGEALYMSAAPQGTERTPKLNR